MNDQPDPVLRDALRARLVAAVNATAKDRVLDPAPDRRRGLWATVVVAAAVVVGTVLVIQLPAGLHGGDRSDAGPVAGATPAASSLPIPSETLPVGKVLGRFTSDDGPNQDHTIRPGRLAIATQFVCTGDGEYSVFVAGGTGESGNGGCDGTGGVGSGNGTSSGIAAVKIRTDKDMRWTYTMVGIPRPKTITPKPIPTPTNSTGDRVPYCIGNDLAVRFAKTAQLDNASGVTGELVFTNRSHRTCALAGYPEVRFLSRGIALGHNTMNQIDPRRSVINGLKAVIIRPGKAAYSQVNWYGADTIQGEGPCVKREVNSLQVDLHYDLAAPTQTGTIQVPIGGTTACLNGDHGALGKYGQIASTVFVDYTIATQQ